MLDAGLVAGFFVDDRHDTAFELRAVSELLDIIDKFVAVEVRSLPLGSHTDRIDRASLFAETAKDATEDIDFIS